MTDQHTDSSQDQFAGLPYDQQGFAGQPIRTLTEHDIHFTQEIDLHGNRLERYRWICLSCEINGSDRHVHSIMEYAKKCADLHTHGVMFAQVGGSFTLAEYLVYMKRGARIQLQPVHKDFPHLPTWVEVTDFDPDTRQVYYRAMTNEELAAWPDAEREAWNTKL